MSREADRKKDDDTPEKADQSSGEKKAEQKKALPPSTDSEQPKEKVAAKDEAPKEEPQSKTKKQESKKQVEPHQVAKEPKEVKAEAVPAVVAKEKPEKKSEEVKDVVETKPEKPAEPIQQAEAKKEAKEPATKKTAGSEESKPVVKSKGEKAVLEKPEPLPEVKASEDLEAINESYADYDSQNDVITSVKNVLRPKETFLTRAELLQASRELRKVVPYNYEAWLLHADVLLNALRQLETRQIEPDENFKVLTIPLREDDIRDAAEAAIRQCAHFAESEEKRISLIDEANRIRRLTWF